MNASLVLHWSGLKILIYTVGIQNSPLYEENELSAVIVLVEIFCL